MSSLEDLHCTKAETSVTAPFISMETILTGMATVRPVRMAVLMISVSYREKGEIFMRQREAESYYPLYFITIRIMSAFEKHHCGGFSQVISVTGPNSFYRVVFHWISSTDIFT